MLHTLGFQVVQVCLACAGFSVGPYVENRVRSSNPTVVGWLLVWFFSSVWKQHLELCMCTQGNLSDYVKTLFALMC